MSFLRIATLLAVGVATSACYQWVPADEAVVPVGAEVRARMTDSGMEAARRYFGPDVESVEGPLVSWGSDGLSLLVRTRLRREGFQSTTVADTLHFEPQHLSALYVRELDGSRTAIFTATMVGLAAGAILAAKAVGGSSDDPGEGGGPPVDTSVILRIPLGLGFR